MKASKVVMNTLILKEKTQIKINQAMILRNYKVRIYFFLLYEFLNILLFFFYTMNRDFNYQKDLAHKSTMNLHHVLQDYRQTEQHKSTLSNKISILKMHYDANKKKTKNIHSSIMKINEVKEHFRREKDEIAHMISLEKENHNRKIAREKEKRQNSKQNIQLIRNLIAQQKQQEYRKIKDKQRVNQLKIRQNVKKSLHEKRQRSLQVKLQEQESRLTKTIFFETKRLRAQRNTENDIVPLELGLSMNERYLKQMKKLESDMITKLNRSRENLSKSKLTLKNVVNQTSYL